MTFLLEEAALALARTPDALESVLAGLSPRLLHVDEGPGTWSAHRIVGHPVHGEGTDWIPRARLVLDSAAVPCT